jgi:rfaE bifunctional protein kinase chain/domain
MEKLFNALNDFKNRNILVLGDIILDKFSWGEIDSLNPEMPAAPKVKIKPGTTYALGGAANVASNISSLGANCTLCGVIGDDENSKRIIDLCSKRNIHLILEHHNKQTITKERVIAHGQQVVRLEYGEWGLEKIDEAIQKNVIRNLEEILSEFNFIVLSDYDKSFFTKGLSQKIIKLANSKKIPTLVDPKPVNWSYFKGCNIISPNEKEAETITGIKYNNGENRLTKMGGKLSEKLNSRYSVITCGKDGVFGYDRETKDYFMVETKAREVKDVTGAGDTFAAILALGLSSKLDMNDSIKLANYGSGIVVEKVGTAVTGIDEIKKRIMLDNKV